MTTLAIPLLCISIASAPLRSQTSGHRLSFEASSIKVTERRQGLDHGGSCHGIDTKYRANVATTRPPLGRCVFPNTTLANIIQYEFGDPDTNSLQIEGGDKWVRTDSFEIQAAAGDPAMVTESQLREMLQVMLTERFKLQFHRDSYEEQGYVLLAINNGRSLPVATGKETRPGPMFVHGDGTELVATGEAIPVGTLVNFLWSSLRQPVQDKTGLTGLYDVTLHFTPTFQDTGTREVLGEIGAGAPGPSLFTAVQEQLGFRLEPRKVAVPIFVIDHAEKPTPN